MICEKCTNKESCNVKDKDKVNKCYKFDEGK